jgi:hypothetical protein
MSRSSGYEYHVDGIRADDIRGLLETTTEPCVSLYMPTHRVGAETEQDPIRLRNLLAAAQMQLVGMGMRGPESQQLLEPAALLDTASFWQHQSDGLAVFLAPGFHRVLRLPLRFAGLLVVAECFHLKPLLPMLSGDGHFYILALSQKGVRLFVGTRDGADELELPELPAGIDEALRTEDQEKELQFHGPDPRSSGAGAVFHGHGGGGSYGKDRLFRFFRRVDRGLWEGLRRDGLHDLGPPLVLAGVGYLLPIYRKASRYPNVVEEGITGNPEALSAMDLHGQAWAIVERSFRRDEERMQERFRSLAGTGSASSNLREVAAAAIQGRVRSLMVAVDVHEWGRLDTHSGAIELHPERQPGDRDLLDVTAAQTFITGGVVFAVGADRLPGPGTVAAILRY